MGDRTGRAALFDVDRAMIDRKGPPSADERGAGTSCLSEMGGPLHGDPVTKAGEWGRAVSKRQIVACLAPVILLAGCGDGGSSSVGTGGAVAATPTPTPSPTPSPIPTPTPTGPTLLSFSGAKQFDTLESILYYNRSAYGHNDLASTPYSFTPTNDFDFSADGPTGTFHYVYSGSTVPPYNVFPNYYPAAFGSPNRINSLLGNAFTSYQTSSGGATYTLTRLNPGPTSQLTLYYAGIGTAEATSIDQNLRATITDFRAFGYSFPAEQSAVPMTGTGQYNGIVIGRAIAVAQASVYDVTGTVAITMDFAARTYSGSIVLTGTDDRSGRVVNLGSFPLTSTTTYATPLNNIMAYLGPNRNEFRAKLAGPSAEELEGSFNLIIPDPGGTGTLNIVGAVGARR